MVEQFYKFMKWHYIDGTFDNGTNRYGKKIHRIDGPAIMSISVFDEIKDDYWIYGNYIGTNLTEAEFNKKLKELVFS